MSKKVAVPKELLARLEEDRKMLWDLLEELGSETGKSIVTTIRGSQCTSTMWKLANTRWAEVPD